MSPIFAIFIICLILILAYFIGNYILDTLDSNNLVERLVNSVWGILVLIALGMLSLLLCVLYQVLISL